MNPLIYPIAIAIALMARQYQQLPKEPPRKKTVRGDGPLFLGTATYLGGGAFLVIKGYLTAPQPIALDLAILVLGWIGCVGLWNIVLNGLKGKLELGLASLIGLCLLAGIGWEIAECAAGTHFGDPGDGSNPFDKICPVTKR